MKTRILLLAIVSVLTRQLADSLPLRLIDDSCFLFRNYEQFRCPAHGEKPLMRQKKPGIRAHFGNHSISTEDHAVQLCYHTASYGSFHAPFDVTLVTFGTSDTLLLTLSDTLETWDGLIHVAIFIRQAQDVNELDQFLVSNRPHSNRLTIHLVWAWDDRSVTRFLPQAVLRNVATIGIFTTHMMYVGIESVPSHGSRAQIAQHQRLLEDTYRGRQRSILVIPTVKCRPQMPGNACEMIKRNFTSTTVSKLKPHLRRHTLIPTRKSTDLGTWLRAENLIKIKLPDDDASLQFETSAVVPTRIRHDDGSHTLFLLYDEALSDDENNHNSFYDILHKRFNYNFLMLPNALIFEQRLHQLSEIRVEEDGMKERSDLLENLRDHRLLEFDMMRELNRRMSGDFSARYSCLWIMMQSDAAWRNPHIAPLHEKTSEKVSVMHDHQVSIAMKYGIKNSADRADLSRIEQKLRLPPHALQLKVIHSFQEEYT